MPSFCLLLSSCPLTFDWGCFWSYVRFYFSTTYAHPTQISRFQAALTFFLPNRHCSYDCLDLFVRWRIPLFKPTIVQPPGAIWQIVHQHSPSVLCWNMPRQLSNATAVTGEAYYLRVSILLSREGIPNLHPSRLSVHGSYAQSRLSFGLQVTAVCLPVGRL